MFANVVVGVPTDDRVGNDAIVLASQLLAPRGQLALVHVLVVTDKPAPDSGSVHAAAKRRHTVEELTDLAQQFAIAAQIAYVEAPSVRSGLHEFVSAQRADLLVVGASRSDEVVQLLLGDDTLEVLEDAPCPVAVAPAGYAARASTIHRIGVAYDGSAESEEALTIARSLARDRGADLSAFEVVPAPLYVHDIWDVRGEMDHHVEEARQQVAALGDVEAEAEFGDPVDALARFAQSVDLLVIGSHKYRPIDRMPQQTTSQQLARRTSSPLLILSPNGRARG
jgi:nucleotide-binding universal stress UspA family protein